MNGFSQRYKVAILYTVNHYTTLGRSYIFHSFSQTHANGVKVENHTDPDFYLGGLGGGGGEGNCISIDGCLGGGGGEDICISTDGGLGAEG